MPAAKSVKVTTRIPMSPHSRRFVTSPRAEADLEDIVVQSELRWGEDQVIAYSDAIVTAMSRIGTFPDIGHETKFSSVAAAIGWSST